MLDPFTGAGTTPTISKELNRNFIGFEIDENYYNIAQRRLKEHVPIKKVAQESPNSLEDALY